MLKSKDNNLYLAMEELKKYVNFDYIVVFFVKNQSFFTHSTDKPVKFPLGSLAEVRDFLQNSHLPML